MKHATLLAYNIMQSSWCELETESNLLIFQCKDVFKNFNWLMWSQFSSPPINFFLLRSDRSLHAIKMFWVWRFWWDTWLIRRGYKVWGEMTLRREIIEICANNDRACEKLTSSQVFFTLFANTLNISSFAMFARFPPQLDNETLPGSRR